MIFRGEFEQQVSAYAAGLLREALEAEVEQRCVFHKVMNVQGNLKRRFHRSEILRDAAGVYNRSRSAAEVGRAAALCAQRLCKRVLLVVTRTRSLHPTLATEDKLMIRLLSTILTPRASKSGCAPFSTVI